MEQRDTNRMHGVGRSCTQAARCDCMCVKFKNSHGEPQALEGSRVVPSGQRRATEQHRGPLGADRRRVFIWVLNQILPLWKGYEPYV